MAYLIEFHENEKGQDNIDWISYAKDSKERDDLIRMNTQNCMVFSNFRGIVTERMDYHNNENITTTYKVLDDSFFEKIDFKQLDVASQIRLSMKSNINDLLRFKK